ncbi:MAG: M20 aminoacylase family protein [Pseudomonadota bacterium]|nr:M20 aminoacylase family protein [Pseudomonadota bacterium]MEC8665866.1 M20 aminoacylase family protein [Pseudomonadota bacterium]
MPVINSIANDKDEVAAWRQELHQNPQTCYEEEFASAFVKKKLMEWGIPFKENIAKTGVVATIEGQKTDSGKRIGLRADMDALDITEKSGVAHASKNPGKMHACGHDGHTATLLGAAKYLSENRNFNGTVHLIFQPAEEGGRGAHKMIEEGLFKDFPCDAVYGLHNWPWMPAGKVATRVGPLLASVDEFEITITGVGGHAAMPHQTNDPAIIASQLVMGLQSIVSRNVDPVETAVLSITNMNVGTGAFNIIGDVAKLSGTVRTFNNDIRHKIKKRIEDMLEYTCKAYGAECHMDYDFNIDATINTPDGVVAAVEALKEVVGEENIDADCAPCMGGEDFGAYLTEKPGAFIFVGQGVEGDEKSPHNHGLHSPYYDFNDDIIPVGASFFARVVEKSMPLEG